jgi:hypothetical protein
MTWHDKRLEGTKRSGGLWEEETSSPYVTSRSSRTSSNDVGITELVCFYVIDLWRQVSDPNQSITSTSLTRVCTFPFGPYQTCDRFWQPTTAIRLLLEQRVAPPPHVSAVPYTPALSYCRNSGFHCSTPFLKGFLTPANACAWSRL